MKKSQLRETIRAIVTRKLQEQVTISHGENGKIIDATEGKATGPTAKYAYIKDKKNPDDPLVQLIGSSKMKLSQLENLCVSGLEKMLEMAKAKKYDSAISQWKNITELALTGLDELNKNRKLQEALSDTQQPVVQTNTDITGKQMSDADKQKIADLEAEKTKEQNDLAKTTGELAKKTAPFTVKINKLQKQIGDDITAISRIKQ